MKHAPAHKSSATGSHILRSRVTIKDLGQDLGLSITTISRALNGYSDVGEATRQRVFEAAERLGYRPNRNAQRLVTRRTHNLAWVQSDNERKFVDPHFVEVMAGILRGARIGGYDLVMASEMPEEQNSVYDRYIKDNSVDGFIIDLPRKNDPRISFLLEAGHPFVVHGREGREDRYGWVDIDNFGNFYRLTRLMIANGRRRFAFVNGDEHFTFALERHNGVLAALRDLGLPASTVRVLNATHPMGDAGFQLTAQALDDPSVSAILYSSTLMAAEGYSAVVRSGRRIGKDLALASMDDELQYLDLTPFEGQFTYVRSSLRQAGIALVEDLIRQCESNSSPTGTIVPSTFHPAPGLDGTTFDLPIPDHRN